MCSSAVYGGTFNLFYKTLHEMGIDCTFVSPNCTEDELNAAFRVIEHPLRVCGNA